MTKSTEKEIEFTNKFYDSKPIFKFKKKIKKKSYLERKKMEIKIWIFTFILTMVLMILTYYILTIRGYI